MRGFLTFIFLLILYSVQAQRVEAGVFVGASNYQGDITDGVIILDQSGLSYGGILRINILPQLTLKGNGYVGSLNGDDKRAKDPSLVQRGYSFHSPIYELAISGEWNIFRPYLYSTNRLFKPIITPVVSVGVGLAFVTGKPKDKTGATISESGDEDSFFSVPIGIGLKYYFTENWMFGFEVGSRTVLSDYLDGISRLGNNKKNDWYIMAGLSLSYYFNYSPYKSRMQ